MNKNMWKTVYGPFAALLALFAALLAMLCLAGCTATRSVTITYDTEGRVVSRTESQESVVKTITDSTAGKTVIAWESGWAAEGLLFLHGLESNPGSSLQTEEEAGLP